MMNSKGKETINHIFLFFPFPELYSNLKKYELKREFKIISCSEICNYLVPIHLELWTLYASTTSLKLKEN